MGFGEFFFLFFWCIVPFFRAKTRKHYIFLYMYIYIQTLYLIGQRKKSFHISYFGIRTNPIPQYMYCTWDNKGFFSFQEVFFFFQFSTLTYLTFFFQNNLFQLYFPLSSHKIKSGSGKIFYIVKCKTYIHKLYSYKNKNKYVDPPYGLYIDFSAKIPNLFPRNSVVHVYVYLSYTQ